MSKILLVYEDDMPTVSITRRVWDGYAKKYHVEPKFIKLSDISHSDVLWCDVLIFIRPDNIFSPQIAKAAMESKRLVITMCDDDLLNLPDSIPNPSWKKRGVIRTLRYSNALMSCSPYILNKMTSYTRDKRAVRSDTVVSPEELLTREYKDGEVVRLVYAGSERGELLKKYVIPAIKEYVSREHRYKVSLTFVSTQPDCIELGKDIEVNYVKGMALQEYRSYMEHEQFDIGIAPLNDDKFSRCKYFNKYLEYSLSGVVGIYSNVEPYTYVVKDSENGFLAENTTSSWEEKIRTAVDNYDLRINCAMNAQSHIRKRFNQEVLATKLFEDIPELIQNKEDIIPCKNFMIWKPMYTIMRGVEYVYKAIFYMKQNGVGSVINKTKARIKRTNAYR